MGTVFDGRGGAAMSDKRCLGAMFGCGAKPRVVFVGGAGTDAVSADLGARGWDVLSVSETTNLTCALLLRQPAVVVLPAQLGSESGFLLAAKLRVAKHKPGVVILADARTPQAEQFARFVGATLASRDEGAEKLAEAVTLARPGRGRGCA
jgi:hypothetical protein